MRFFSLKLNIIRGKLLGSRAKNAEIQTNSKFQNESNPENSIREVLAPTDCASEWPTPGSEDP